MISNLKGNSGVKLAKILAGAMVFLSFNASCFASIILHGNQVITAPTIYKNVVLDLTDGRFTINTGGRLRIENSIIEIDIYPGNPFLVQMNNGSLDLRENKINVKVSGIPQTPDIKALYRLMNIQQGNVNITSNSFTVDTHFSIALLEAHNALTNGLKFNKNIVNNFHGGISLINSSNAEVRDNEFNNVSFSNVYNIGNLSNLSGNIFSFPGNLKSGNAFDIINSDGLSITNNIIASGSNHGISIVGGNNLFIENNKITDGKSFAIIIHTPTLTELRKDKYLTEMLPAKNIKLMQNNNILISNNYIAQNKYGIRAGVVDQLIVNNNTFIQRFTDSSIRQYWTNNDILLPFVSNLSWTNNTYKEAFTQDNSGDNTPSLQFVNFPAHGGVFIN